MRIKITSYPYISCLHDITLPSACFVIWRSKWENRFIWDLLPTKKHYLFYITLNCTKCPRKCLLYLELVKTKLAAGLIGFVFLNVLMENGEITITAKTRMAYEQGSLLSYTCYDTRPRCLHFHLKSHPIYFPWDLAEPFFWI